MLFEIILHILLQPRRSRLASCCRGNGANFVRTRGYRPSLTMSTVGSPAATGRFDPNLDRQVEQLVLPDGEVVDFVYDTVTGQLTETIAAGGRYVYTYDSTGRESMTADPAGGSPGYNASDRTMMRSRDLAGGAVVFGGVPSILAAMVSWAWVRWFALGSCLSACPSDPPSGREGHGASSSLGVGSAEGLLSGTSNSTAGAVLEGAATGGADGDLTDSLTTEAPGSAGVTTNLEAPAGEASTRSRDPGTSDVANSSGETSGVSVLEPSSGSGAWVVESTSGSGASVFESSSSSGDDVVTPIFVAVDGMAEGTGDASDPVDSVQRGLDLAAEAGRHSVALQMGEYTENLLVRDVHDGITVEGGWRRDGDAWSRDASATAEDTTIVGGDPSLATVDVAGYARSIAFARLAIATPREVGGAANGHPGESLYAVFVRGSSAVVSLVDFVVRTGDAGAGGAASSGASGDSVSCTGTSGCSDGRDGADADDSTEAAPQGTMGVDGYVPATGSVGAGGGAGHHGTAGGAGTTGSNCTTCTQLSGCITCSPTNPSPTSSAGRCGCGGGGGVGGAPGSSGGASIPIFIGVSGAQVTLVRGIVRAGRGGDGSAGGAGGDGASGSSGQSGSSTTCNTSTSSNCVPTSTQATLAGGTAGGRGGRGGSGGRGQSGAGGPSCPVWAPDLDAVILEEVMLEAADHGVNGDASPSGWACPLL